MLMLLDSVAAPVPVPSLSIQILRDGVVVYSIIVYGTGLTSKVVAG